MEKADAGVAGGVVIVEPASIWQGETDLFGSAGVPLEVWAWSAWICCGSLWFLNIVRFLQGFYCGC